MLEGDIDMKKKQRKKEKPIRIGNIGNATQAFSRPQLFHCFPHLHADPPHTLRPGPSPTAPSAT